MAPCCNDSNFGPRINDLLIALDTAFDACGKPVCRAFLTAATAQYVPIDNCCQCLTGEGQLWVAVGRTEPMNTTGAGVISCTTNFEATINVGIARCAATVDSQGNPPDPDLISTQALAALRDMKTMYRAISDWISNSLNGDIHQVTIGAWTPSVQGGCQVGSIDLTFRFEGGCC
jgi:hypothetical protein